MERSGNTVAFAALAVPLCSQWGLAIIVLAVRMFTEFLIAASATI